MFSFKITKQDQFSRARVGILTTPNGSIETPAFIFCATKGSIKSLDVHQLKKCNTQIILANTYHLMLRPGPDLLKEVGGIHKFMGWKGPMLTDSGGFQIFSLGHGSVANEIKGKKNMPNKKSLLKITEDGAVFKSYVDGTLKILTPESAIQIQNKIGADLILVLDECTPYNTSKEYTAKSMEMSHRWGVRSLNEFEKINNGRQALYGIVQGGIYEDLRNISCNFINDNNFFGCAIGGTLGGTKKEMYDIVDFVMKKIRKDRPVHLLGIGGLIDILHGVLNGVDTFDCVHPTRLARHGGALITPNNGKEYINLVSSRFQKDERPIEENCLCPTCTTVSRAYIHHLIKCKEITAHSLITQHNVYFMNEFMSKIRDSIKNNTINKLFEVFQYFGQ